MFCRFGEDWWICNHINPEIFDNICLTRRIDEDKKDFAQIEIEEDVPLE